MSSTQSKVLMINGGNAATYLSKVSGDAQIPLSWQSGTRAWGVRKNGGSGTVKLTASAMDKLFPNATAHPTSMTFTQSVNRLSVIASGAVPTFNWHVDDTEIIKNENITSGSFNSYTYTVTSSAVTDSNRSSVFDIYGQAGTIILIDTATIAFDTITVSADFTRYDFWAAAGSGVTSASVSSSTGYDGDTVTFSCVIPTGYVFDGWYNGTTLVSSSQSYTHTVNGADLSLTAKAHQDTHSVNGTYNGSTKAILTGVTGDVTVSYNGRSKTLNSSAASHTLSCANKAMHGNVSVGSASLATAEKIMRSDLVLDYV